MYRQYFKRFFDFVLCFIAVFILLPILALTGTLVYFKLGWPIVFKQKRPGKNGCIFEIYKFRTMTNECDENGNVLSNEKRLTSFGKKLRATSIDELPELFNIIKGDMSIVGPRPLLVKYLPLYSEQQKHRHDVRPGLTGLAQVNGRNTITWEDKFKYDLEYVKNITFIKDIKIIFLTIVKVFKRDGINASKNITMKEFRGNKL